jgi:tetratricopeptide (TPR) repeat protein
MALDAYSNCLCGSGKKFKWCCAPVFETVEKAYAQEHNKQHAVALRMIEDLTKLHAQNAAVWCYLADLLMMQGKFDEAQKAIAEALKRDPHFAKALYLQGAQLHEKERHTEALDSYRKAADACDPHAKELMADIHLGIAQLETIRNHPFAAKAAIDVAHRCEPSSESVQNFINRYYGVNSDYPSIVRKNHAFKNMIKKDALPLDVQQATQGGKLGKLHHLMEGLVARLSYDPGFFFNLGLSRAWVGENRAAIEALDEYVRQASDEQDAAEAWALADALRLDGGDGIESDHVLSFVTYKLTDPRAFLEKVRVDKRVSDASQNELLIQFNLLDRDVPAASETLALFDLPRVLVRVLIHMGAGSVMIYTIDREKIESARAAFEQTYGSFVRFEKAFEQPGTFLHITQSVFDMRMPQGLTPEQSDRFLKEKMRGHFEDIWAQRPLHSLKGNTPLDASGHPVLRRKVLGCILLMEQVLNNMGLKLPYTMDELRHKLGLDKPGAAIEANAPATVTGMNVEDLAALKVETASEDDLKQAFTSAKRLDANELANKFAQALVQRAATTQGADCFTYDQHIIFQLLGEDRIEKAFASTLKAMDRDTKLNGGKRSVDYRKLRLKVLLAGKRLNEAKVDLDKLFTERNDDLDLYVFVTEELLRFGHKELASKYASQGKALAEKKSDRDRLGFFDSILKRHGSPAKG